MKVQGQVEIGKGPVIAYAPAVQQKLRDLITDTADEKKIPFQRAACLEQQEQIQMLLLIVMVVLLRH